MNILLFCHPLEEHARHIPHKPILAALAATLSNHFIGCSSEADDFLLSEGLGWKNCFRVRTDDTEIFVLNYSSNF